MSMFDKYFDQETGTYDISLMNADTRDAFRRDTINRGADATLPALRACIQMLQEQRGAITDGSTMRKTRSRKAPPAAPIDIDDLLG